MSIRTHTLPADFLLRESLPTSYQTLAEQWLAPLSGWIAERPGVGFSTQLLGVHGGQGSGKTTLCKVLTLLLAERGLRCETLSLDDFYLTRAQRLQLADRVHPLFATRGVPGTHDVTRLQEVIGKIRSGKTVGVPIFDKSLDDRLPESECRQVAAGVDILLLEGWCVGCVAQGREELAPALNRLEAEEDPDSGWRRYVNQRLAADYAQLFAAMDGLIMLAVPSMQQVLQWRCLQEHKLARLKTGTALMSERQLERFVQHYERLTRHALAEMPARADYLLKLDAEHNIVAGGAASDRQGHGH